MTILAAERSMERSCPLPDSRSLRYTKGSVVPDTLRCGVCRCPAVDPLQANCPAEHLFCKACVKPLVKKSRQCPTCQQPVTCLLEARKAIAKALDALDVACPNEAQGCHEAIARGSWESHLAVCPYSSVDCADCGAPVLRSQMPAHATSCPRGPRRRAPTIPSGPTAPQTHGAVPGRGGVVGPAAPRPTAGPAAPTPPPAPTDNEDTIQALQWEVLALKAEMQRTMDRLAQGQPEGGREELQRAHAHRAELEAQLAAQRREITALAALVQSYDRDQRRREPSTVTFADLEPSPSHLSPRVTRSNDMFRADADDAAPRPSQSPPGFRSESAVWGASLPRDVAIAQLRTRTGPSPGRLHGEASPEARSRASTPVSTHSGNRSTGSGSRSAYSAPQSQRSHGSSGSQGSPGGSHRATSRSRSSSHSVVKKLLGLHDGRKK